MPEPSEEDILLANIDATEEEARTMSDTQKEKDSKDLALEKQLEHDALKPLAEKSRRKTVGDKNWTDEGKHKVFNWIYFLAACSAYVFVALVILSITAACRKCFIFEIQTHRFQTRVPKLKGKYLDFELSILKST